MSAIKTELWPHQRDAVRFASERDAAAWFMAMGTGKSAATIALLARQGHQRTLILCPLSVVSVWRQQFATHAPDAFSVTALDDHYSVAKKAKLAADALVLAKLRNRAAVIVTNYEAARTAPLSAFLLSADWDCVVLDESHRAKASSGSTATFTAKLGRKARHRLILTGTPMPHGPLDIWNQFRFLDPTILGGSFLAFRNTYAVMGGPTGTWVKGYQREEQLASIIDRHAFRVDTSVLTLPEALHETRPVELEKEARRVYDALEREFIAEVEGGEITAANALVKLLRLQQITGGTISTDEGHCRVLSTAKVALLSDILSDLPPAEPVVVFARFRSDLDAIREVTAKQGRTVAELSGRRNDLDAWQRGEADVLATQIQAGGVGVDLTRARICVFYSLGYSLGEYEQALARVHRPGQRQNVAYYHVLAANTVDEQVYAALRAKRDVVAAILAGIKEKKEAAA